MDGDDVTVSTARPMTTTSGAPAGLSLVDDDARLREALAADLDGAFENLVVAYQRPIFNGLLRMTGSRATAEDLAQDAFVRVYRALGEYPAERI